jgi:hypothetical protein
VTLFGCAREKEVAELVRLGQWPQAFPAELRAHVSLCRACGELVLVSGAFQRARVEAGTAARLEAAGPLWWRAQLLRRNAAIERIRKPILGAEIFALTITLLVAVGFLASEAGKVHGWLSWFEDLPKALHFEALWPSMPTSVDGNVWLVVPVLALLALLSGVVVYFASEKQ